MLKVENLTKHFGGLKAVEDVTFAVDPGEIVGLIGPNGAGKTTVFNLISRVLPPTRGQITFAGHDLLRYKTPQIIQLGLARTFQNLGLFPYMSVLDNLLVGQHGSFTASPLSMVLAGPRARREEAQRTEEARTLLRSIGLEGIQAALAGSLPYGTQKFIELSRALLARPRMLLLDEPVAGMNPSEREEIRNFIQKIHQEQGLTILLVEHDMNFVMGLCDRIVVLSFGQKLAEGPPEQIRNNPRVVEAYLGEEVAVAPA
jgi:ABC-type branched-subunit amino acid transport system ATPase component